jgi:FixJ family two-component response regulator
VRLLPLKQDNVRSALLSNRKRVFVVDDSPGVLRAMERLLQQHGYDTVLFGSAEAFEKHTCFKEVLCVLLDINLDNGRSGIQLRHRLKEKGHAVPVIYMTANDNPVVHKAALESGCLAYFVKPVSARSLIGQLERASHFGQATI